MVAAFRSDVGPDGGVLQWDTDDGTVRNPGPPDGSKEGGRGKGPKPSSHHLTFLTLFPLVILTCFQKHGENL